ncbi:hypothetical protein [Alkalicoccobacillus plakortidis]|uniref:Uncharacterized protein n=1 Tax=Alkalicoccobacillus plakortidis TaxID=444060 RepID=A0ABT0XMR2_9BACI|nr:hypothetical protein [Alkalicoccobacillus plakortidis]MCM2677198.1 hypothetical protein [Alkalicoccobacillus plakortidis]
MIQFMVDSMLGPYGKMVSTFYLDHQLIINSFVVGIGMISLIKKRKKQETTTTSNSLT